MSQTIGNDLMEYAKRHLLAHMRAAGKTNEEIELQIMNIPVDNAYRSHFVTQYIEQLPEDQRKAASLRLEPKLDLSEIA